MGAEVVEGILEEHKHRTMDGVHIVGLREDAIELARSLACIVI